MDGMRGAELQREREIMNKKLEAEENESKSRREYENEPLPYGGLYSTTDGQ